jgi:sporulation-control protein spo0M
MNVAASVNRGSSTVDTVTRQNDALSGFDVPGTAH